MLFLYCIIIEVHHGNSGTLPKLIWADGGYKGELIDWVEKMFDGEWVSPSHPSRKLIPWRHGKYEAGRWH
jgi:hypothetical protein